MSPNPVNQADGDNTEIPNQKIDMKEFLFDVGALLNNVTAQIIESGKLLNANRFKEKEYINIFIFS
jgi:hypothetical protein